MFDQAVRDLNRVSVLARRLFLHAEIVKVADRYPLREPAELEERADVISTVIECGIILASALGDPSRFRAKA